MATYSVVLVLYNRFFLALCWNFTVTIHMKILFISENGNMVDLDYSGQSPAKTDTNWPENEYSLI